MAMLKITRVLQVGTSPEKCWEFWSNPENFVRTFDTVSAVKVETPERSVWTLNLPSGKQEEVPMQRHGTAPGSLSWVSLGGPITFNTGFSFRAAGASSEVALETEIGMEGLQGMMLPAMRPVIEQKIDQVLQRFKSAIEQG